MTLSLLYNDNYEANKISNKNVEELSIRDKIYHRYLQMFKKILADMSRNG